MNGRPCLAWVAVRGFAGFFLGYALWMFAILPAYTPFLAAISAPVVRLTETDSRWHTVELKTFDSQIRGRPTSNVWRYRGPNINSYPMAIDAEHLHWNIFVLLALFCALPPSWRPLPAMGWLAVALAFLAAYHVLGVVIWSKYFYASRLADKNAGFQQMTEGYYTAREAGRWVLTWRGPFYDALAHFHSQWGSAVAAAAAWAAVHGLARRRRA